MDNTQNKNHLGLTQNEFKNFNLFLKKRSLGLLPQKVIENPQKPGVQIYLDNALAEMSGFIDFLCNLPNKDSREKAIEAEKIRLNQVYKTQPSHVYCHTTVCYAASLEALSKIGEFFDYPVLCTQYEKQEQDIQAYRDKQKSLKEKSVLGEWYGKTLKKIRFSSWNKFFDSLESIVTEEQWQQASYQKVEALREKYGFDKIFIEHGCQYRDVYKWASNMDKIMEEYCHDFHLDYHSLSLDGGVNLAYDAHYLKSIHAEGSVTGGVIPLLSIKFNDMASMKRTLIHEYTHLVDRRAGMQYLKIKHPEWTDNTIHKEYGNKQGVYLSHQLLEQLYLKESSPVSLPETKEPSITFMKELMTRLMSNQSVQAFETEQNKKITQIRDHIQQSIIIEMLRKTRFEWSLLDKSVQENILAIPEFQKIVQGTIASLMDRKASFLNEHMFEGKTIDQQTPWFKAVDKIAQTLAIAENQKEEFYQYLWQKMPAITLNCEAILHNYGLTLIEGLDNSAFPLLAQGKVARYSFETGNLFSDTQSRQYYVKPLEILARHIESLYEPDTALLANPEALKLYPVLDDSFKDILKQSLGHLLTIADVKSYEHHVQNKENNKVGDTIQNLREKMNLLGMNVSRGHGNKGELKPV